jgi:hypothetical protein
MQKVNKIGYTPDWLKVSYKKDRQNFELTLDIQGEITYNNNCLNCRCKGDLIPWVLYNCENGDEIDLYDLSEAEVDKMFPIKKIAELLQVGTDFRIGVYPINSDDEIFKLADEDVLSDCIGLCEIYDGENEHQISFIFETEFNG